jgi:hypothetical protein
MGVDWIRLTQAKKGVLCCDRGNKLRLNKVR